MQFSGVNIQLLDRKGTNNLMEFEIGNEHKINEFSSSLSLYENSTFLSNPNGYQNVLTYHVNDLYLKGKYRFVIKDLHLFGKLSFHQLSNKLESNDIEKKQNPFFVNPSLGFKLNINSNNIIGTTYSYTTTNADLLEVYDNFALTGFRSFSKGFGDFKQLNASTFLLNHQLGNWGNRFFANTILLYNKNHDFFSTRSIINQNYIQSEKIVIKDRKILSLNSKLDYYISKISSNLKFELGYFQSEFKNIINNSDLREITSNNYAYGLELRTGFKGFFNFHLGTKWTTSRIKTTINNSFTNNISFIDLSLIFSKKFDFQLQTERYFFGSLEDEKNYFFLDFDTRYVVNEGKLTLGLSGKNLFNTRNFKNYFISDIGTYETEYRLLPRFALLKIEYRF